MPNQLRHDDPNQLTLTDFGINVPQIEAVPKLPSAKKGTAASARIRYKDFGELTFSDYEVFSKLPEHPLWGQIDRLIDFSFADELCAHLYSPYGQRPYAPSLKLKLHLIQAMESLSDRELEVRLMFDMAIKRLLGIPLSFTGLDHSTLGLDRERMGDALFHACFHYVLAQAKHRGLWGKSGDTWLVDSFHTLSHASLMGVRRLIQKGILAIIQHLKRTNPSLFHAVMDTLKCATWFEKTAPDATSEEQETAFHMLVLRAYSLLSWFEQGTAHVQFWQWENKKQQLRSLELQAILYTILQQNTRPAPPKGPALPDDTRYEKIPRKERPQDRIVNAHDPDLRIGTKKAKGVHTDKIQVVTSNDSGFILEIEPIPGNEHDGERLKELVTSIMNHHEVKPELVSADTAYGYGRYRERLVDTGLTLIAPIAATHNPSGLLSKDKFTYSAETDHVTCPQKHTSVKKVRNNVERGYQYYFDATTCASCPLYEQCTTNGNGRSIFISDHHPIMEAAKIMNETPEGQQALRVRSNVERTNNELANHHELRHPYTRGRKKLRILSKLKGLAVNVKLMVKKLGYYYGDPFVRQKSRSRSAPACA